MRFLIVLFFCLAFAVGCELRTQPPADLVLRGGKVVTLNPERPVAEAIAVTGERITVVGSTAEVDPYVGPETRVIELEGALVIPGFIESHAHFMDLGTSRMKLDLTATDSAQQIAAMVEQTV
jgi:predicted amidohydrolase YtcJ